mgnify:CR=1 FL=1
MCKEKRRVPKLRFPGFTEDWEQYRFNNLLKKNLEKNDGKFNSNKTISIARMKYNKLGNGASNESLNNYKVLRFGDIAFEGHENKDFKFGRFVMNDIGDGIMSPRFTALRPIKVLNVEFWKEYINYEPIMQKKLVNSTKKGTMMHELVVDEFLKQDILLPSKKEQQKIGRLLKLQSNIINLYQRKVEHLILKKKALLQKLFPRNGNRYPDFRFPGFTAPWEQRKLGDYLSIPEKEILEVASSDDLITVKLNLGGVELGASRDTLSLGSTVYYKRYAGQFIYGKQNFFNGSMGLIPTNLDGKGSSGDVPSFNVSNIEENYLYIYVSRESYWRSKEAAASGTGSKRIHEKTFLDFNIDVPSMDEQKLISNTFDLIDRFITLHQRKLEHLQIQKKSLLQKLFV